MSKLPGASGSHSTILGADCSWWLEPGLAELAFGSRPDRRASAATGVAAHLALLPPEAIEIDLSDPQQRQFGDYELLEQIGQGGMGVVYRAWQESLKREVALKVLAAGPWASPDFISRFKKEAQSVARLQHPNIVAIHEIGAHEEMNFFSMVLIKGGSLAQKLARSGPLPPRDAARMLRTIAEAVDYAHRYQVLHLDLKPANVLIDEHGEPQVVDFGLAKRMDESLSAESGEVSGTPSYMAPEQTQSESQRLSPATDIYGLGAVLYECLTARPPFAGGSAQETLRLVVAAQPTPLRTGNATIPPDLEAICLKCLAKDPAQRYPTARSLADDLNRFLEGRATLARPLNVVQRTLQFAHREPKLVALLALVLFSLAMGFAASALQWQRAERNATDARHRLWEGRRESALQLQRNGDGMAALPRLLANLQEQVHNDEPDTAALERRRMGLLEADGAAFIDAIAVADANPLAVALSPDGSRLAVSFNDQSVRWYDTSRLQERGRVSMRDLTSSDGQPRAILLLRFIDNTRLIASGEWYENQANPAGGDSWLLDLATRSVVKPPAGFENLADAALSPNGRFAVLRDRNNRTQLWQTSPWRALSGLSTQHSPGLPWLVDPQGRYAASLSLTMVELEIHSTRDFAHPQPVNFPNGTGISAWATSHSGGLIGLGDFEGGIHLVDTNSRANSRLSSGRGRQIAWLEFSEDDAWVVAGNRDGTVVALDVATGDSVTGGALKVDFPLHRVSISHARRLLVASGTDGQVALWRVGLPGPLALPARRIGLAPARHGIAARFATDWSAATGLFASAGVDGQIRLWRLPAPVMQTARAASQVPERFSLLGNAIVDVAWDRLRVQPMDGRPAGPWLQLPQAPGFAEMVDSGKRIAVTLGPTLAFYDAASLRRIGTPLELPATPERLAVDGNGARIALLFGDHGVDGFEEQLQVFDARSGQRLPGEATLAGPQRRLGFSPDGRHLLAVGPPQGVTAVLDANSLLPERTYPHDPYQPVVWADFSPDSKQVRLLARALDKRLGGNSLVSWTPSDDRSSSLALPADSSPIGVLALEDGRSFIAASAGDWFAGKRLGAALPRPEEVEATAVLARSADGRLLAHAARHEVQLFDTRTETAIGLPLQGDGDAMDQIAGLAFTADGSQLVARTLFGRWLRWSISPESRPVAAIASDFSVLASDREHQRIVQMPSPAQRKAWRARDPGTWPAPESRADFGPATLGLKSQPIPARNKDLSPLLVDLSSSYDVAPEEVRNVFYNLRPALRPLPVGLQRMAGQWFDIRGMAQIGDQPIATLNQKPSLQCVALPDQPVAALYPLLLVSMPHPVPDDTVLGELTLHYRDGGTATLPIVAGRDVRSYSGDDKRVPLAFAGDQRLTLLGLQDDVFSAPRLVPPDGARRARCFDLRGLLPTFPIGMLALTVDAGNRPPQLPLYPSSTAKAARIPGINKGVSR